MQKIVLLTSGSQHGEEITKKLKEKEIVLNAIVYVLPLTVRECISLYPNYNSANLIHVLKLIKHLISKFFLKKNILKKYQPLTDSVIFTGFLNSREMERLLKEMNYDYLLLGGTGILKENIINTAKKGVLNSHPGLLPWARGTGVVSCSIKRAIPVGSTCHFVNKGIDLGDVVLRKLLPIKGSENSLEEIEKMNDVLAIDIMVEVVEKYITQGIDLPKIVQTKRFPICNWLKEEERKIIDDQILKGMAHSLFIDWQYFCEPNTLEIKNEIDSI